MINGNITRSDGDGGRRYTLSFSSEDPDTRFYMPEILDHGPGAVDLSRLKEMGVVLFNHDTNRVVGKVLSAEIESNRGVAEIEFDSDEFSQTIADKVDSGTLKGVSVRARASSIEEVQQGATSADGRFTGPCLIYRKWTPMEVSIATIPADPTVGVGRSEDYQPEEANPMNENENSTPTTEAERTDTAPKAQEATRQEPLAAPAQPNETDLLRVERERSAEITTICREFGMEPDSYIKSGATVQDVHKDIVERLRQGKAPVSVKVQRDEGDKFREAATDSLLLRAGIPVESPAPGASEMRPMRLRDLLNECARAEGIQNPERMRLEDLLRQFFTPSAAFPAILDAAVNKSYLAGYKYQPTTFDIWTTKGTLHDFKPTKAYLMGSAGALELVPEGGEIKHDKTAIHARPERQLQTYGKQFTLTREAIYNDDIDMVTTMPQRYALSSKRTINRQVYSILSNNPAIYDGFSLFSAQHKNLIDPGTLPSLQSLQVALKLLALMLDDDGEMIYAVPRHILTPVGMGDEFRQIIKSVTIAVETSGIVTSKSNPLVDRGLEVVEEAALNVGNADGEIEWYLVADKTSVPSVQVDYLNGNETPIIRRSEVPGQTGYIWDILLDWGITVLDYRGLIKNKGSRG